MEMSVPLASSISSYRVDPSERVETAFTALLDRPSRSFSHLCACVLTFEIASVGDRSPAPMTMSDTHSTALRDRQIRPLPDVSQRADAIG